MQPFLRRILGIEEIEASPILQTLYWALLAGFFLSFNDWISSNHITLSAVRQGSHVCPPYFQSCDRLYFLENQAGQNLFYAFLSLILVGSAIAAWRKDWTTALALMVPPFLWKIAYMGFLTHLGGADPEYFHLPEVLVFLFLPRKEFFLRRVFVTTYLLAATMKFTDTWIVGSFFTSLQSGLPLVPDLLVPLVTLSVGFFETFSPWFLLNRNRNVRWPVVALWTLFHVYSVSIVLFRYPAHCLPLLWILFLPDPNPKDLTPSWSRREIGGWSFIAFLVLTAMIPRMNFSDWQYTLTGRKFGVAMFTANYQCVTELGITSEDGSVTQSTEESRTAKRRCDPYATWFRIQNICERGGVKSVAWIMSTSVNGGPFYRIINTGDACKFKYHAFQNPDWIQTPKDGAPIIGFPAKNFMLSELPEGTPTIHEQPQIYLSPLQKGLVNWVSVIASFQWILWVVTAAWFIGRRLKKN